MMFTVEKTRNVSFLKKLIKKKALEGWHHLACNLICVKPRPLEMAMLTEDSKTPTSTCWIPSYKMSQVFLHVEVSWRSDWAGWDYILHGTDNIIDIVQGVLTTGNEEGRDRINALHNSTCFFFFLSKSGQPKWTAFIIAHKQGLRILISRFLWKRSRFSDVHDPGLLLTPFMTAATKQVN